MHSRLSLNWLRIVGPRALAVALLIMVLWIAYDNRLVGLLLTWPVVWSYLYSIALREQWDRNAARANQTRRTSDRNE